MQGLRSGLRAYRTKTACRPGPGYGGTFLETGYGGWGCPERPIFPRYLFFPDGDQSYNIGQPQGVWKVSRIIGGTQK